MSNFTYLNIEKAYQAIHQKLIKTPLVSNDYINKLLGAKIYFKLENLQKTGSFKLRGATYKVSKLSKEQKLKGIVAYSSGNHAQAVAYACLEEGISAKIIMPKDAPKIKIENTQKLKAQIIYYDRANESREKIGEEIASHENRTIIKPYDDYDVIAGQGTAAFEISQELNNISVIPDIYLCCCGGGGLIAGTSTYLKHKYPNILSYAAEPFGFDDTKKSLDSKRIIANESGFTSICDAIVTPQPGKMTFPINLRNLSGGVVVDDEEVKQSIKILAEHLKIVAEPGGAVAATAALTKKIDIKNKTVVVMISGGNIDLDVFCSL